MCRIKWVDRENMLACIEAGTIGTEIERKLGSLGLIMGHEPDSYEHSTMGGWIATVRFFFFFKVKKKRRKKKEIDFILFFDLVDFKFSNFVFLLFSPTLN